MYAKGFLQTSVNILLYANHRKCKRPIFHRIVLGSEYTNSKSHCNICTCEIAKFCFRFTENQNFYRQSKQYTNRAKTMHFHGNFRRDEIHKTFCANSKLWCTENRIELNWNAAYGKRRSILMEYFWKMYNCERYNHPPCIHIKRVQSFSHQHMINSHRLAYHITNSANDEIFHYFIACWWCLYIW